MTTGPYRGPLGTAETHGSTTPAISGRATQPPGRKDMLLGHPTTTRAGGGRGTRSKWGGPTPLDCRTAQAVLPDGWGQHPTACVCRRGSGRGPRARRALPCPGDQPGMSRLRHYSPGRQGGGGLRAHHLNGPSCGAGRGVVKEAPVRSHPPLSVNCQPPSFEHQPPSFEHQPPSVNRHPPSVNRQPGPQERQGCCSHLDFTLRWPPGVCKCCAAIWNPSLFGDSETAGVMPFVPPPPPLHSVRVS